MSWLHLHLIINHVPLLGSLFGLALLIWGLVRRSPEVQRAALATFVVTALFTAVTFLTGEPAEEAVEGLPGVAKTVISQHEDAAYLAFGSLIVLGVVALAGLVFHGKAGPRRWLAASALVMSLVAAGLVGRTASLGGQIRHSELRAGAVPSGNVEVGASGEAAGRQGGRGHLEDDD